MQIQSPLAAASIAAAAVSQSTAKDRASTAEAANHGHVSFTAETIGRAEQSSADRDAQGGGEGLDHGLHRRSRLPSNTTEQPASIDLEFRATAPEPPSQLDLLG